LPICRLAILVLKTCVLQAEFCRLSVEFRLCCSEIGASFWGFFLFTAKGGKGAFLSGFARLGFDF